MEVGADIDNQCTKCGVTTHVVVGLVEGKLAKVECKQCGSVHRFRDPDKKKKTAVKKKKAATRKRAPAAPVGPLVEPDLSLPVKPYQVSDTYRPGERIQHKVFGAGVIEQVMGPLKVRVFFEDGQKILIQGKVL
ncbi:MAG: hypothetical protein VCE43_18905 [Myxococcota bacterium]